MKVVKLILLFLFGIVCLFEIRACFNDYIYSENEVLDRLVKEVSAQEQEYLTFLKFSRNLKDSINWDIIRKDLENVSYQSKEEPKLNFLLYPDNGGGITHNELDGCSVWLPDTISSKNLTMETIQRQTGLTLSALDSLINYANILNEGEFCIYKDGSVIIEKSIGPELLDRQSYEIIYKGEKMFLYGHYRYLFHDVYIGKGKI